MKMIITVHDETLWAFSSRQFELLQSFLFISQICGYQNVLKLEKGLDIPPIIFRYCCSCKITKSVDCLNQFWLEFLPVAGPSWFHSSVPVFSVGVVRKFLQMHWRNVRQQNGVMMSTETGLFPRCPTKSGSSQIVESKNIYGKSGVGVRALLI